MECHSRRLLLLNEDLPISPLPSSSSSSSSLPRPIFISNLAYAFLVLFTAIFFFGFFLLYIHQFSCDSSSSSSSSSAAKKPLPAVPYRRAADDSQHEQEQEQEQQAECAICLDEFVEGEAVKVIPYCKHVYHPRCIDTWLAAHVTCPVCRCTELNCEVGRGEVDEASTTVRVGFRRSLSF